MSMLSTAVSGAEALNTWILPAAPTLTGAEKVNRSGASAHTFALDAGNRLLTVTADAGTLPPVPAVFEEPAALPPAPAGPLPPPLTSLPPEFEPEVPAVSSPPPPRLATPALPTVGAELLLHE